MSTYAPLVFQACKSESLARVDALSSEPDQVFKIGSVV